MRGRMPRPTATPTGSLPLVLESTALINADLAPMFEYFRADQLPTPEGYVGGESVGTQGIDQTSPNQPQTNSDPIF